MKVKGTFEVSLIPLESNQPDTDGINIGRFSIDKTYFGDLSASSQGQMLSATTSIQGSAGYVAIEHVSGSLNGMHGSFVLQHYGTMNKSNPFLLLEVIPHSGAKELVNLSGKMSIDIKEGQHYYEFDYDL